MRKDSGTLTNIETVRTSRHKGMGGAQDSSVTARASLACLHAMSGKNVKGAKHPVTLLDHCTLENWTFRSQDHLLPGTKVPGVELSLPDTD